jgi:hypothetical protein
LHGGELRSYEVLAVIVKLLFGECFALNAQLKDGHARSIERQDQRWKYTFITATPL